MYIFIYLCIHLFTSINIYIYILKKEWNVLHSFAKERNVLAFFYIVCKIMLRSLRSFTFFAKEHWVLCALFCSLEMNGNEQNVLLGLISNQKLEKRTERSLKEWERTERSEWERTRCPTLPVTAGVVLYNVRLLFTNILVYLGTETRHLT